MNMVDPHESFNSSGMFIKHCSMNFIILRLPSPSFVKSSIAVCILNIIFGIVGTFFQTFWKLPSFCGHRAVCTPFMLI